LRSKTVRRKTGAHETRDGVWVDLQQIRRLFAGKHLGLLVACPPSLARGDSATHRAFHGSLTLLQPGYLQPNYTRIASVITPCSPLNGAAQLGPSPSRLPETRISASFHRRSASR
jgi:hypothetical protein